MIYDVAVIGGGPAGYVAAIKAARLGGSVVLFESDTVGGTCLNRGCVPTKTYVKTAEYLRCIRNADKRGISVDLSSVSLDMRKVVAHKNKVVKILTTGVAGLLKSNGVEVAHETARLASENKIEAGGAVWEARNVILCGGSEAGKIPVPGIDHPKVLTSDAILEMEQVPPSLAIIGGGVIGCELAAAFRAFGSEVTIIEAMPRLVSVMDAEVSDAILKSLKRDGVKVFTDAALERVEDKDGRPVLCLAGGEEIIADAALLSVGRVANLECLGELASSIATENGKVIADDFMRANVPGVFAAGDIVSGKPMLAHAAFKMGETAAANAMGQNARANLKYVPSCLYTMPEASGAGLTEEQAAGRGVMIGKFPMAANARSLASGDREGFVKVIADEKNGEILGVHMVCGAATELIAEAAALMSMEITVREAADIVHAHPTFSEAFMEACADALGRSVHLPKKS